jgi:parvulin-like peptidyl-prolyl isomerase
MNRIKFATAILLVLSFTMLYGCGEGKYPGWFKLTKPSKKEKPQMQAIEGTALASIDTRTITLENFKNRIQAYNSEIQASADIPDSLKKDYLIQTEEDKKRLLDGMVERELLVAEAIDRGLDQDNDLLQAIKALKEQLLFAKLIEMEKANVTVTTKEVENYYNLYKDAFSIPEERRVNMIVVGSEAKAKEILITLLQGGDFAALARANSIDKSASSGGDIGFIVQSSPFPQGDKKMMFKKFEEEALTLDLNKPSTIFKGPDGFYIIKVVEIKEARQMLLSEVYNDIQQGLLLQKQDEGLKALVGNLRKSADIIVHDELLTNTD